MPSSPCLSPRCPNLAVYRGRCAVHSKDRERETHRTGRLEPGGGRMYGQKRWILTRRKVLARDDQLCQICLSRGVQTWATDVDHIIPVEDGGEPWDLANLRSLCRSCHSSRHRKDRIGSR